VPFSESNLFNEQGESLVIFKVEANNIEYGNIEDRNIEFDVK